MSADPIWASFDAYEVITRHHNRCGPSTERQNLAANIEIGELDVWTKRGVELLPFIRLLCREPEVNITTSSTPIGQEIEELLSRREEWAKVLNGTVEEMKFVVIRKELKDQGSEFQIPFKNEFAALWIWYGDEGGEILDRDCALEFVRELGNEADDGFISVWLCLQSDEGGYLETELLEFLIVFAAAALL
jgi:hypothetical protein